MCVSSSRLMTVAWSPWSTVAFVMVRRRSSLESKRERSSIRTRITFVLRLVLKPLRPNTTGSTGSSPWEPVIAARLELSTACSKSCDAVRHHAQTRLHVIKPSSIQVPQTSGGGFAVGLQLLLGAACGLLIANVYYAQPLTGIIGASLGLPRESNGLLVTLPL